MDGPLSTGWRFKKFESTCAAKTNRFKLRGFSCARVREAGSEMLLVVNTEMVESSDNGLRR